MKKNIKFQHNIIYASFLFIIYFLLLSCDKKDKEVINNYKDIKIYESTYDSQNDKYFENRLFREMFLKIDSIDEIKIFTYSDSAKKCNTSEKLYILTNNENEIVLDGIICPFYSKKDYLVNGEKYTIKKYFCDNICTCDDEQNIFINDKLGIIRIHTCWRNVLKYSPDPIYNIINDSISKDTSNFNSFENRTLIPICIPIGESG